MRPVGKQVLGFLELVEITKISANKEDKDLQTRFIGTLVSGVEVNLLISKYRFIHFNNVVDYKQQGYNVNGVFRNAIAIIAVN